MEYDGGSNRAGLGAVSRPRQVMHAEKEARSSRQDNNTTQAIPVERNGMARVRATIPHPRGMLLTFILFSFVMHMLIPFFASISLEPPFEYLSRQSRYFMKLYQSLTSSRRCLTKRCSTGPSTRSFVLPLHEAERS